MAVVIHIYSTKIRTSDGLRYEAQAHAHSRGDGRWEAWLQFEPVDQGAPALATDIETTQSSEAAVRTWSDGLESTYLQGAFERAYTLSR
jgi:hypothetical protein